VSKAAVVAYSGGLDTSCILAWLKEDWYGYEEVVAVLVDVGQEFDLEESVARANAAGADDIILVDRKDAFADEQCARAILTNALYEGKYPLVSALSRPVIAGAVADIALELGAEAVVHGCTGKGNDQLRFELAFRAHYPGVTVIAPLRDKIWTRDEEIEYAIAKGIPVVQTARRPTRSTRTSSGVPSRQVCSRIRGTRRRTSRMRSRPIRRLRPLRSR
jgi:argininosuccinate synthase